MERDTIIFTDQDNAMQFDALIRIVVFHEKKMRQEDNNLCDVHEGE